MHYARMRHAAGRVGGCLLAALLASGCASTKAYFADRGRDVGDIVSLSVGEGAGAKVRVSALSFGFLYDGSVAGLRTGSLFAGRPGDYAYDVQFFCCNNEYVGPPGSWERNKQYHVKQGLGIGDDGGERVGDVDWCLVPPMCLGPMVPGPLSVKPSRLHYYTQIDAVVGVGGTLRVGVNPGELLDLLLGVVGIDFMKDDLARRQQRESAKATPDPAPAPSP